MPDVRLREQSKGEGTIRGDFATQTLDETGGTQCDALDATGS